MTTKATNAKSAAWDLIGSQFWEAGRTSAKPSPEEIGLFLREIPPGARCAVIGASTKDLIEALIGRGAVVTVLDFSARMCTDLAAALPAGACQVCQLDITAEVPAELRGTQDVVLSDRLINRFSDTELQRGLTGMLELLAPGGQVRASVKMGLYPMDERMIAIGTERGCLQDFYRPADRVIDFAAAGEVLVDALLAHGQIPAPTLLDWYRGRGREKRVTHEDMTGLIAAVRGNGRALRLVEFSEFPQAPQTTMYVAEASDATGEG
ncbi:class I SAM-dependent methyltransferase [Mangrovihabitans endophyticus]|uniref:Methyltransferase domain-containing protein n=1 Tax=Mangrovihabitans endophyticus TaxID=1751298 RepID=A0A8J3FLV6_9ACTN|nr:class I SAM-dependent methyltransferase [Mangrovihabitans endophyticus]GGK78908.1 hypothetical protein GCM10012284_11040 [Mangrovihabitans endophyticus]